MAKNFDELLAAIHNSSIPSDDIELKDEENNLVNVIKVSSERKFIFHENFNKTIAYAGDVNSQILTFNLPIAQDKHLLSECKYQKVKWKNKSSGIEGTSTLLSTTIPENDENYFALKWEIPPEAFTMAGSIEFSFAFYDFSLDNKLVYSWNTSDCTELLVGKNITNVGEENSFNLPAPNEILLIDADTRTIVAPIGYNMTVVNYGDIGTAKVYFQIKDKIRGISLSDENTTIDVKYSYNQKSGSDTIPRYNINNSFAEIANQNGLINFVWDLPEALTNNEDEYDGVFKFSLIFSSNGKKWTTAPFEKLIIGKVVLGGSNEIFAKKSQHIIDGGKWNQGSSFETISGIVKIRKFTTPIPSDVTINQNELIAIDDNGKISLLIGTADNQKIEEAEQFISSSTITDYIDSYLTSNEFVISAED